MEKRRVVVYGWYNRGNVGDELMRVAIDALLTPRGIEATFVDRIDDHGLDGVDALIFGGGSILYNDPHVSQKALSRVLSGDVPVFYLGVGGETGPSQLHRKLLDVSEVVAFRELDVPDLAYSLALPRHISGDERRGLLFIPNVEVVPTHDDAHWAHIAWERFKDEASQFLDRCIDRDTPVSFLLMCSNDRQDDAWPAGELIGRMRRRGPRAEVYRATLDNIVGLARHHAVIVTQRYHGIVLAEWTGTPYINVHHHDKLAQATPGRGTKLPYHGARKDQLTDALEEALASHIDPFTPPRQVYDDVIDRMVSVMDRRRPRG